jgi:hypothetical protein
MSRNRTAILVNRTVEVSVFPSSPRCACSSSRGPNAAGLRIALTCSAMILQRIEPMVWAVMPEMAVVIICLASGCSALAGRIA